MNDLVTRCLAMSRNNREILIAILEESLEEKETIQDRFQHLLKCATRLMGDGILSNSRDFFCVFGRMLIAYQMHKEGFGWSEIGRQMGRPHSSVICLAKRMEEMLKYKVYYRNENALWEEFQKLIEQ